MGRSQSNTFEDFEQFRKNRRMYFVPGTFTFVVPSSTYRLFGIVIGAGGSGASSYHYAINGSNYNRALAGAGGGYASGYISVIPEQSIVVTVGTGGSGDSVTTNPEATSMYGFNGQNGGTSSIGTYLTATGGEGGKAGRGFADMSIGGSGSTSGVVSGFTSSGGTGGNLSSTLVSLFGSGGGASGSPYGNGGENNVITGGTAAGGGGWGGQNYRLDFDYTGGGGVYGAGSVAEPAPRVINEPPTQYPSALKNPTEGQRGFFLEPVTGNGASGTTVGLLTGDSRWWFPWEADGNSGMHSTISNVPGGNGGFGSGGGAAYMTTEAGGIAIGGNGGFGGGGGGIASNGLSALTQGSRAGNGGRGGGGGSCSVQTGKAGRGGNGCVIIYW